MYGLEVLSSTSGRCVGGSGDAFGFLKETGFDTTPEVFNCIALGCGKSK